MKRPLRAILSIGLTLYGSMFLALYLIGRVDLAVTISEGSAHESLWARAIDIAEMGATAPAQGPADLVFRPVYAQLSRVGGFAARLLAAFVNCLFWATLIYYGWRTARRWLHPEAVP